MSRIDERLAVLEMNPREASIKAGLGVDAVRNISRAAREGKPYNPRSDTLQALARALETSVAWLTQEGAPQVASAPAPTLATPPNGGYRPTPEFLGARDLPVFSAVEGGPGEMVVHTDPIEWVQRPWFLREVKEGYAVIVTGESMSPVYEPGDLLIVNPRLPAIPGKNAIFVAGEDLGEFRAMVKRLQRSTTKEWHVKQWNPPEGAEQEFSLSKREWTKALRVVGKYEGG